VILVSHDRRFLETVTTRTLSFTPLGVDTYEGGFKDYVDALERQRRAEAELKPREAKRSSVAPKAAPAKTAPKPAAADEREAKKRDHRDLERKRKRVSDLERQISDLEATLASFREELKTAGGNWERLHELALKDREYSELLERAMKEWVTLSDELSKLSSAGTGAQK
jgi:ATPase subunit of ABC transporter with duplicated ATPase domains